MGEVAIIGEAEGSGNRPSIRVETALSRFPIHRLAKAGIVEIDLHNQAGAVQWEVSYNSKYGQPGPLAYKLDTLVINRRFDEAKKPAPELLKLGSLSEIAKELGLTSGGNVLNEIKRALHQNASAYVQAKLSYRGTDGSEHWIEEGFGRYSVIFTGQKLPNGQKADAVYIRLHTTYRTILNNAITRPLDYDYMKELTPSAQRLYEVVSYPIHQSLRQRKPSAKLRYSTYCLLAPAPRYPRFEQVKKQMYKLHRPHLDSGYLRDVKYESAVETTKDEKGEPITLPDWIMHYHPGPNASRWYRDFLPGTGRQRRSNQDAARLDDVALPLLANDVPQRSSASATYQNDPAMTTPSHTDYALLDTEALAEALIGQGMTTSVAQRLARTKPEICRQQLAYLPHREPPKNKGAFLRRAIEDGFGAPVGYQEAQADADRERHHVEAASTRQARRIAEEARIAAEATAQDESLRQLETGDPALLQAFSDYVAEELRLASRFWQGDSDTLAQRFQQPEYRRQLLLAWQCERAGHIGEGDLRLPAAPYAIELRHISKATIDQIATECEVYNAQRGTDAPEQFAYGLANTWIKAIHHTVLPIADVDRAFIDYAIYKLYQKA